MFCWCYYAHITRIARSSPLGPVGLVPERGEGKEGDRKERERKPARKQLPGKMTDCLGLFRQVKEEQE